jgi:hypothetical protein
MDGFRYVSENTVEHLSLHDCDCSAMRSDGEDLAFEVEWIEVLATHPDNPFPQAHQSGEGRIILHGAHIERGELIKGDKSSPIDKTAQVKDFEILDLDEEKSDGGFVLSLYGVFSGADKPDFIEMKIRCLSSAVMFSELGEVSWFEDLHKQEG